MHLLGCVSCLHEQRTSECKVLLVRAIHAAVYSGDELYNRMR